MPIHNFENNSHVKWIPHHIKTKGLKILEKPLLWLIVDSIKKMDIIGANKSCPGNLYHTLINKLIEKLKIRIFNNCLSTNLVKIN